LNQTEAVPQWRAEGAGPGGGSHQGERGEVKGAGAGGAALAHREIEAAILHRRVEELFRHPAQPVNLIDEQQLARLQIHQQTNDVAGTLEGGSTGDPAGDPELLRQHHRHGGFAETGRAVEQHVVEGIPTRRGRLHRNPKHLLEFALPDVVIQPLRPQAVIPRAGGLRILRRHLRRHQALRLGRSTPRRTPGALRSGCRGLDRHGMSVPRAFGGWEESPH